MFIEWSTISYEDVKTVGQRIQDKADEVLNKWGHKPSFKVKIQSFKVRASYALVAISTGERSNEEWAMKLAETSSELTQALIAEWIFED